MRDGFLHILCVIFCALLLSSCDRGAHDTVAVPIAFAVGEDLGGGIDRCEVCRRRDDGSVCGQ